MLVPDSVPQMPSVKENQTDLSSNPLSNYLLATNFELVTFISLSLFLRQ